MSQQASEHRPEKDDVAVSGTTGAGGFGPAPVATVTAGRRRPEPTGRARVPLLGSPFIRIAGRRLIAVVPVMWAVTLLTFALLNLLPGSTATALLGTNATPAALQALTLRLHLNEPFFTRYWSWLTGILDGHLGTSLVSDQSVSGIIASRLPVTIELVIYGFLMSIVLALPTAVISARRPGGIVDRLSMATAMIAISIAPFVMAFLLILVFSLKLEILPAIGFTPVSQGFGANIESLTLPALSIALPMFGTYSRMLRGDLVEACLSEGYVDTARAKGLGPWRVLVRHALPNSLLAAFTLFGLSLATLLGSTVIVEEIFGVPGIGLALLNGINDRDIPVVEGIVIILALVVIVVNLLTDLSYMVLDPRIRDGRPAE